MGKLLFVPMLTYGHFNCCINISRLLIEKHPEHEIYFLVSDLWAKKLEKWEPRFKPLIYMKDEDTWKKVIEGRKNFRKENGTQENGTQENGTKQNGDHHSQNGGSKKNDSLITLINEVGEEWGQSSLDRVKTMQSFLKNQVDTMYERRSLMEKLVDDLNPDVVCFDTIIMIPFLMKRPFVQIMTMVPNFMDHPEIPPYSSGYTSDKSVAHSKWKEFRRTLLESTKDYFHDLNLKLCDEGQRCIRPCNYIVESPYFNCYIYPREIDFFSVSPNIKLPGKWIQLDSSFIPTRKFETFDLNDREGRFKRLKELYDVPEGFLKPDSKLVLFSLGSMASANRNLILRLIKLIGNVPEHRFIVSKGLLEDEYSLPANCVGKGWIDQFETLKIVDLVIGHGGNNTLCESFHMGVPLVLMPLFSDQPDNAQRLIDTKMGYALNAFKCTQEELNSTINHALNNKELINKMQMISKRIQKDNGMNRAAEEFHNLLVNHQ